MTMLKEPICGNQELHLDDTESAFFVDDQDTPFHIEYKWEGKVDDVIDGKIIATIFSVDENEWDELEIEISDLNEDDLPLVREGALFNFYIGYKEIRGSRRKIKLIKFRRINLSARIDQILESLNSNDLTGLFVESK